MMDVWEVISFEIGELVKSKPHFSREKTAREMGHPYLYFFGDFYAAAMRRIRSSCSCLLSAPMVKASSRPNDSAYLMPSS